jgi:hypothetical protein
MKLLSLITGTIVILSLTMLLIIALSKRECREPMPQILDIVITRCAFSVDPTDMSDEICKALNRAPGCALDPEKDQEFVGQFIFDKIVSCAKEDLEKHNICSSKVEEHAKNM